MRSALALAAEVYVRKQGTSGVGCKLNHENDSDCIFRCRYGERAEVKA